MTLATLGVDIDYNPALAAAAKIREALGSVGPKAKEFSEAFKAANKEAGQSASEAATVTEAMGTRAGNAFRTLRTAAGNALSGMADELSKVSSAIGGNFTSALDGGYGKIAALVTEIALLTSGMGILSIPILAVGAAFGPLGTIVAAGATLFFLYSSSTLAARTALLAFLTQVGLTNVGLRVMTASATAANTAAAAMGISLPGLIFGAVAAVLALVAAYKLLKLAVDSVDEGAKRQIEIQKYGIRSGNLDNPGARVAGVVDTALTLPGDSTEDILKGAAALEKASAGALTTKASLEAVSAAALVAGKDFSEVADKVADLYKELQEGKDAEDTIRALQKLGIFSDQARDAIAKLQEEEKKGPEVWAVAAAALDEYNVVLTQRRDTFKAATESISKAWAEVKAELGGAVADALTPALNGIASAMRALVPIAREVTGAIRQVIDEITSFPQNAVDFIDFITSGGKRNLDAKPGAAIRRSLPAVNPTEKDTDKKSSGGSGRTATYETDAGLVEKYRQEIEYLSKAMGEGTVSTGEFITRQAKLQDTLAAALGDPSRYAADVGAFRAAQQEKLRVLEAMKQQIEAGNASLGDIVKYTLTKTADEWGKFAKQVGEAGNKILNSFADGLAGAFANIITGAKTAAEAFREFATSLIGDVVKILAKMFILYALQKAIGFATGTDTSGITLLGSLTGAVKHSGGLAGEGGPTRDIIPRFHTGGLIGSDERLIIAQKDEGVFTPAQMRALAPVSATRGGGDNITVNVSVASDGGTTSETRGGDNDVAKALGAQLPGMIKGVIANEKRRGGLLESVR